MKYIEKLLPQHDKLKHFYVFTIQFILLNIILSDLLSLILVFISSITVEIIQKVRGGKNTLKENVLDIVFSIMGALGFYLSNLVF